MTMNNHLIKSLDHIVARDPMSPTHNMTSFVPIWYVQQTLLQAGVLTKWTGSDLVMTVPYPRKNVSSPKPMVLNFNTMDIVENGQTISYAPQIKYHDAGTTTLTTYVPIYYIQQALEDFGTTATWNGSALNVSVKFPDGQASLL
jgi:hypothetical protein